MDNGLLQRWIFFLMEEDEITLDRNSSIVGSIFIIQTYYASIGALISC
jgi:hypothetical protein